MSSIQNLAKRPRSGRFRLATRERAQHHQPRTADQNRTAGAQGAAAVANSARPARSSGGRAAALVWTTGGGERAAGGRRARRWWRGTDESLHAQADQAA